MKFRPLRRCSKLFPRHVRSGCNVFVYVELKASDIGIWRMTISGSHSLQPGRAPRQTANLMDPLIHPYLAQLFLKTSITGNDAAKMIRTG